MNLKTTLITLIAFCFVTSAAAIDDKKKKTKAKLKSLSYEMILKLVDRMITS